MLIAVIVGGAFLAAYLITSVVVPPITRTAITRKLFDLPDRVRRTHAHPVPPVGGIAVFAGMFVALVGAVLASPLLPPAHRLVTPLGGAIVLASGMLFILGLADDIEGLPPLLKLGGETAAALVVYYGGFRINLLSFPPSYEIALGWLSLPVTITWLVGVSNAFNLIDGIDGLAGGVAVIALVAIAAASIILGNLHGLVFTVALLGAMLAFLRYNFPPAKIFLGDSGSLVVGFLLAVLSVTGATHFGSVLYALTPIFVLSYLLLDTGISILRRVLRGTPILRGDDRHIHHQLQAIGATPRQAMLVIYVQAAAAAALGLCVTFVSPAARVVAAAAGGGMLVFILAYGLRKLGYHEFTEAFAFATLGPRKARTLIQDKIDASDVAGASRIGRT